MGIQIGAKPDAGFDNPLGMLKDCHRRIEHFLEILCVVAGRAKGRAMTAEESSAIQAALDYFHSGGPRHNADEEESLFPRMRAAGLADELPEIGGLVHDHRNAEQIHARVDALYSAWIANGRLSDEQHAGLAAATGKLKELYTQHIEIEEKRVFPRAARMLDPQAIATMGQEFKDRRS